MNTTGSTLNESVDMDTISGSSGSSGSLNDSENMELENDNIVETFIKIPTFEWVFNDYHYENDDDDENKKPSKSIYYWIELRGGKDGYGKEWKIDYPVGNPTMDFVGYYEHVQD